MVIVSVCLIVYKEEKLLTACLQSIAQQINPPPFEVIVVDNSGAESNKDTRLLLNHPRCHRQIYLKNSCNNVAQARAIAVEQARGEYILFTDPDCTVGNDWIESQFQNFRRANAELGDVGGVGGSFEVPARGSHFLRALSLLYGSPWFQLGSPQGLVPRTYQQVDHLPTLNAMFLRQAILLVGNFDPLFSSVCEDVDIGFRLRRTGRKCLLFSTPKVQHNVKPDWRLWLKRCFRYGGGQVSIIRKFESVERRHLLVIGWSLMLIGFVVMPWHPVFQGFMMTYLVGVLLAVIFQTIRATQTHILGPMLLMLVIATHLAYACGFIFKVNAWAIQQFIEGINEVRRKVQFGCLGKWTDWFKNMVGRES